ncbi:MAG: hypothetical protein QOG42_110 [Solirubrobacteraceae bacterium]|nr:hypothetical protein [Solirubrobacteraceae bacterium]
MANAAASQYPRAMPVKMSGRYPEGSDQDRAHKMLKEHDVEVDHVYGVDMLETGQEEITFTFNGHAKTAFAKGEQIEHVMDGWDVLPPKPAGGIWRGGY